MKLFQRTLLFFASVILFQAALVVFLVTRIINGNNLAEARVELQSEAERAYNGFNAWKLSLWKSVIKLSEEFGQSPSGEDGSESRPVRRTGDPLPSAESLKETLERLFALSGYDFILFNDSGGAWSRELRLAPSMYGFAGAFRAGREFEHPYIRISLIGRELYLIGSVRLYAPGPGDEGIDVHLVKHISPSLLAPGGSPSRALVSLVLGSSMPAGLLPEESAVRLAGYCGQDISYQEMYDAAIDHERYNAAVLRLGSVEGETAELAMVVALSNGQYADRITAIGRTVLLASLVCAMLSAVMSLFFSRNISLPVSRLLEAMRRVRDGSYDTLVRLPAAGKSGGELGELLAGFNDMAATIHQDRLTMNEYIDEIVFLKDYNEKIIHSIRTGIAIIDPGLTFRKANQCFLDFFNLESGNIIGKTVESCGIAILDETVATRTKEILSGTSTSYRTVKRTPSNGVFEIRLYPMSEPETGSKSVSGCILTVDDIGDKVELEEKIFQAEKLSSISMLSAGVAHEINNPLSSIMANVQNLLAEETDAEKAVSLRYIEQETRRIAGIVRELLDFSSRDTDAASKCDLNAVIGETVRLMRYSVRKDSGISLRTRLARNLPPARIGRDEFKQVLINLVKNAIQAVPGSGNVSVVTHRNRETGKIIVKVEDTGVGIKAEDISHIFDPFFTTKRNGEGTGLGLSVVYGIMSKYDGTVRVKSREGVKTTFTLEIPEYPSAFDPGETITAVSSRTVERSANDRTDTKTARSGRTERNR